MFCAIRQTCRQKRYLVENISYHRLTVVFLYICVQLLPNKVLRASVDEFLRRARTEQQEREQLVKEAEQKALAKQKAATLASASSTGRTGESADAVLDIKKAGRKDELEEDDEFGGDIFGNIDEKEDNGKNLQPSVAKTSVFNANTLMSPALAPGPGAESVPSSIIHPNIAGPDMSLNGIVATKSSGDGPPGTTPTQDFPGNTLGTGNEQGTLTAQQQQAPLPPAGNQVPPMGNQIPWNGPGMNPLPQNGMGYMRPEAWFDGPRPPGPWFDNPGMPWYDGPFPGGPMDPRAMKGGRGRGYSPLHGGFYGAPDCFAPHVGPPDYFGPPPPWFDGTKPPYGNGAGRGDSQFQGRDQTGSQNGNKSESNGRSHSKDHFAGDNSHYSPNVNENGRERGRSRTRGKMNRSNRTFRRGRSQSRNQGRGDGSRKSKYSRDSRSRSRSRSQNYSRSRIRSGDDSKHHSPCTRRSASRNGSVDKRSGKERKSRSKERSVSLGKKEKEKDETKSSKQVEESSKDIKIDQIGAPAIDLDFLNDEMIDDVDEVHVKEQDKASQGASGRTRKSRSREKRSPVKRISSNRSHRSSTSRHFSQSSGHKRHHSTSSRRSSPSRSRRSIRGESRVEHSEKKSVKSSTHSTSHGREHRGRENSRDHQREREREQERGKTRERHRDEKEHSPVKSVSRIRDGDKRKRKETKHGRDVAEGIEQGKGKRRRGQEKADDTQGKKTSSTGSASKRKPQWECDEGSRRVRNQPSARPNNSGKRHIEYEDEKDRKKTPSRRREESRTLKSRGDRIQAKKRSVLDRLGPALD